MTDLRERLHESVADATVRGEGWDDLWRRGRRQRLRRHTSAAVGAVAAVLVLLGAVAGVQASHSAEPPVTAHHGQLGIPSALPAPSGWEHTAHEGEPVGPLAAVVPADQQRILRSSLSSRMLGVSAVDGRYTFLDLPHAGPVSGPNERFALSPDGTRLAYWMVDGRGEVFGFAEYDALDGTVHQVPIASALGLSPLALAWFGDSRTLFVDAARYTHKSAAGSQARVQPVHVMVNTELRRVPVVPSGASVAGPVGRDLALFDGRRLLLLHPRGGTVVRRVSWPNTNPQSLSVSPNGRQIALDRQVGTTITDSAPLAVATVGFDSWDLALVHHAPKVSTVLGWAGPHRVAVVGTAFGANVKVVDVRTGATRPLLSWHTQSLPTFATALLRRPLIGPGRPGLAFDQTWLLVLVPLLGLGVVGWRRRARR